MKIACVVCTFPPYRGGIGNSAYQFAKQLTQFGHEITIFTPDYGKRNVKSVTDVRESDSTLAAQDHGLKIVKLRPVLEHGNAAFLPQLLWRLNNFDVIHLHFPFFGAAEIIILKKILSWKKTKLIIHYHMDTVGSGLKGLLFKLNKILLLPWLASLSEIITCASLDYIKHSDLADYYRSHRQKFRQTLFGVDAQYFCVKNKLASDNQSILFVGGLDKAHNFKGLENLISAFKEIKKNSRFEKAILKIVGEGGLKKHYQTMAINFGLGETVVFYENIGNQALADIYNQSRILVLPSVNKSEAFGLVLLEAMACGRPVVASNLPGVRSVFKNGRQGLLVKPGDIRDLAMKLKIILDDAKLAETMGRNGRCLIEKQYTWQKVAERLNIIYNYVYFTANNR